MASRGVNKVIILGNVGQDPEVRYMPNGAAVANLSIATSERWKDQAGNQQERTEWHRIVFYRKLAEIVGEYVKKGSQIYIEGKLRTDQYEKNGEKRYSTVIVAEEMQMLGDRRQGDSSNGETPSKSTTKRETAFNQNDGFDADGAPFDDDIPFMRKHYLEGV